MAFENLAIVDCDVQPVAAHRAMISTVQSLRQTRARGRTSFKCCRAPIIVSIVASDIPLIYFSTSQSNPRTRRQHNKTHRLFGIATDLAEPFELSVRGEPPRLCWRRGRRLVEGSAPSPTRTRRGTPRVAPPRVMAAAAVIADLGGTAVPLMVHPGERREGADGEPEEARGSKEHRGVSVPEQVVRVHTTMSLLLFWSSWRVGWSSW